MFYSIKELVEQAELDFQGNVAELMIATEYELTGREREEVLLLMERNLEVMKASVELGLDVYKRQNLHGRKHSPTQLPRPLDFVGELGTRSSG